MKGALILDNQGVMVWVGIPLVGTSEDHVGKSAWYYALTAKDAEVTKLAWAHAMHSRHPVRFVQSTSNIDSQPLWEAEYQRLDVAQPLVACTYWQVVHNPLAPRELEIAKLFASDWKAGEIAEKLGISHHTVETVRQRILAKLGVRGVAGITKWLIRARLIEP